MSRRLPLKFEQKSSQGSFPPIGGRIGNPFGAYIHDHGWCAICRHREESRHHGAAHCKGEFRRQHPRCTSDGKRPRFETDMAVIADLKNDKAPG